MFDVCTDSSGNSKRIKNNSNPEVLPEGYYNL